MAGLLLVVRNAAKNLTGKKILSTGLLLGKNKRTTTGRKGMREIERLEQENERLYRSQATMAKQIKLLNSKLANSTDNDVIARAFDKLRQFIKGATK